MMRLWIVLLVVLLALAAGYCLRPYIQSSDPVPQSNPILARPEPKPVGPGSLSENGNPLIEVANLSDGEVVGYPLLILSGRATGKPDHVTVTVPTQSRIWPTAESFYRGVVQLEPGDNEIRISAPGHPNRILRIRHVPIQTSHRLRFLYVLSSDGDGSFQAPPGEPADQTSALRRIATAGRLQQAAIAELLFMAGQPRMTFCPESNFDGSVDVGVVRLPLTTRQIQTMAGLQIWLELYQYLQKTDPSFMDRKYLAFLSMTRFDPVTRKVIAHTALGGGNLALYGSGNLHTWPQSPDEIATRFSDVRVVSDFGLYDDSALRGTFWANFTTGLGASLHELGHVLGLSHSGVATDLMERGFDHINHLFMPLEGNQPIPSSVLQLAPSNVRVLSDNPWIVGIDVP
ncbi:MAG: hypothetical protein GX455_06415 [Phycisphaerae bacterium]|nr:hypothetical protein [Phycisphaerae bacterium]